MEIWVVSISRIASQCNFDLKSRRNEVPVEYVGSLLNFRHGVRHYVVMCMSEQQTNHGFVSNLNLGSFIHINVAELHDHQLCISFYAGHS